jgi:hypothetical protein
MLCVSEVGNKGIFDDSRVDSRGRKHLTRLKEYNTKSAIYNCANSWSEIKTESLKNTWNKLNINEEVEFDLEGREGFHGAFGAVLSDAHDWLSKDEDCKYQNLTEEETAQAEEDGSSEGDEDDEKEKTCSTSKFSAVKDSIISFMDSNPQYNKY